MGLLTYGSDIIDGYIGQVNKDKYQISFGSGLLLVRTKGNSISWQYKYKFGNKKSL